MDSEITKMMIHGMAWGLPTHSRLSRLLLPRGIPSEEAPGVVCATLAAPNDGVLNMTSAVSWMIGDGKGKGMAVRDYTRSKWMPTMICILHESISITPLLVNEVPSSDTIDR